MALLSDTTRELYMTFLRMTVFVTVFVMSPLLMSKIGVWATELITNKSCVDLNCFWEAFGQLFLITLPGGIVMFLALLMWLIIDLIKQSSLN